MPDVGIYKQVMRNLYGGGPERARIRDEQIRQQQAEAQDSASQLKPGPRKQSLLDAAKAAWIAVFNSWPENEWVCGLHGNPGWEERALATGPESLRTLVREYLAAKIAAENCPLKD